MRKLLYSNFTRLWKSKIFWVLECIVTIASFGFFVLAIYNTQKIGEYWFLRNGNYFFFLILCYIGILMAVFSSFYVGTDYSEGTLRNKITVGHSRANVYFSNMIVTIVTGMLLTITHMIIAVVIGAPFLGDLFWKAISAVGWRLFAAFMMIICYGAIFTFFSMQDSNKSRNIIITFVLSLLILIGGLYTYGRLQEPEFNSKMVMQEDGSFLREDGVPNRRYISGAKRKAYTVLNACIPASQAFHVVVDDSEFDPFAAIGLLVVSVGSSGAGILRFKKKDLR